MATRSIGDKISEKREFCEVEPTSSTTFTWGILVKYLKMWGMGRKLRIQTFRPRSTVAEQKKKTPAYTFGLNLGKIQYKEILPSVHLLNSGTSWDGKVKNLSRKSLKIRLELVVFLQQKN